MFTIKNEHRSEQQHDIWRFFAAQWVTPLNWVITLAWNPYYLECTSKELRNRQRFEIQPIKMGSFLDQNYRIQEQQHQQEGALSEQDRSNHVRIRLLASFPSENTGIHRFSLVTIWANFLVWVGSQLATKWSGSPKSRPKSVWNKIMGHKQRFGWLISCRWTYLDWNQGNQMPNT